MKINIVINILPPMPYMVKFDLEFQPKTLSANQTVRFFEM